MEIINGNTSQDQAPSAKSRYTFTKAKTEDSSVKSVYIITIEQSHENYLDIIPDLEFNLINVATTNSGLKQDLLKRTQKSKVIDFERKKEMVVQQYKSLLQRNCDVERSVNSYKTKMKERKKIDYDPSLLKLKGDAYSNTITVVALVNRISRLIGPRIKPKNDNQYSQYSPALVIKKDFLRNNFSMSPDILSIKPEETRLAPHTTVPDVELKEEAIALPKVDNCSLVDKKSPLNKTLSCTQFQFHMAYGYPTKSGINHNRNKNSSGYKIQANTTEISRQLDVLKFGKDEETKSIKKLNVEYDYNEKRILSPRTDPPNNKKKFASLQYQKPIEERRESLNPALNWIFFKQPTHEFNLPNKETYLPHFDAQGCSSNTHGKQKQQNSISLLQRVLVKGSEGSENNFGTEKLTEFVSKKPAQQSRDFATEVRRSTDYIKNQFENYPKIALFQLNSPSNQPYSGLDSRKTSLGKLYTRSPMLK